MDVLKKLIGQAVSPLGRALDMLCIPIAEPVGVSRKGADLHRYEVHCQCAWRLVSPSGKIIVASNDIYRPPSHIEWTEDFHWNGKDGNLFDEKIEAFNKRCGEFCIEKAEVLNSRDLRIEFDNGVVFEAFADSSIDENWRVFQRSPRSIHLVCDGSQLRTDVGPDTD